MQKTRSPNPARLKWMGPSPGEQKKTALLIPEYNESSQSEFFQRLKYFKKVSDEFGDVLDVIIIDDGSTDDSLNGLEKFLDQNPRAFYLASLTSNANKVGALYLGALAINHEMVILSDFDTDLGNLGMLLSKLKTIEADPSLMGCFFRMLPYEGSGNIFLFQQLEYSMARSLYQFYKRDRSVPVMPGAGCCYKREVLVSIFNYHSGLLSGEDREATLIGLKLGFKTYYEEEVLALTRPPLSFWKLVKQRIRWNLGYIETFYKERKFYATQMKSGSRIGVITLKDMMAAAFVLLFPLIIIFSAIINVKLLAATVTLTYVANLFWCYRLIVLAPSESVEFKSSRFFAMLHYPFIKMSLDHIAWSFAFIRFFKSKTSGHYSRPAMGRIYDVPKRAVTMAS